MNYNQMILLDLLLRNYFGKHSFDFYFILEDSYFDYLVVGEFTKRKEDLEAVTNVDIELLFKDYQAFSEKNIAAYHEATEVYKEMGTLEAYKTAAFHQVLKTMVTFLSDECHSVEKYMLQEPELEVIYNFIDLPDAVILEDYVPEDSFYTPKSVEFAKDRFTIPWKIE